MNYKRILLGILLCASIPSYAGFFGGGGNGGDELIRLIASIEKATGTNGTATLAEIQSKIELVQQTKMQIEQMRMEVENFKTLGKDLADLDLRKINNLIDRTLGFKDYASMTANQMEKNLDSFFSDYDGNRYKIFDKIDLDILKKQRKRLREEQTEMQKAIYNNMSKNNMYANIKDQGDALKRKVNTLNNVAGTLQAIQAVGGILEQTNQILLEMKQMMATNAEMKDRLQAKVDKEKEITEDNIDAQDKVDEAIRGRVKDKFKKDAKKSDFTIHF